MPNHDVVGEEPDPNRLDILTVWSQIADWIRAGVARRLPTYIIAQVGQMRGVVDAAQALEAAAWIPAGTTALVGQMWERTKTASEEPVTQAEYDDFKTQAQALNLSRRI